MSMNEFTIILNVIHLGLYAPSDQNLIANQRNYGAKYLQTVEENWTKK